MFNPSDVIVPRVVNELELLIAYETATVSLEEEPVTSRITRNASFSTWRSPASNHGNSWARVPA